MRTRIAKPGERIFIIKVIQSNLYGMVRGFPYRVLAIPEEFTLYQLARVINDSFGFDFDHPFGFYDNMTRYYSSQEGYELFTDLPDTLQFDDENQFGSVKKTRVNRVFNLPKKKMLYLFDYGDEWLFRVELTAIEPAEKGKPYPACIKTVGIARPQYEEPDELEELCRIDDDEDDEPSNSGKDAEQKNQTTLLKYKICSSPEEPEDP
jgi:hypothetical protein